MEKDEKLFKDILTEKFCLAPGSMGFIKLDAPVNFIQIDEKGRRVAVSAVNAVNNRGKPYSFHPNAVVIFHTSSIRMEE